MADGRVDDIYTQVKQMAVSFRVRPGDRFNEVALARELGVSRTPLREVLNRLVSERMVDFRPGAGFFCRGLEAKTIFDLYELRRILECDAAMLACARASDEALADLERQLHDTGLVVAGLTVAEACAMDEAFHNGIAGLSGNAVLAEQLNQINERIRYIRWINLSGGRIRRSKDEHIALMAALMARDGRRAQQILARHIDQRMDQVVEAVRQGIANIYMDTTEELLGQLVEEGPK